MASFPQASPPTPCAHLYPPPYALHTLPISFFSISPAQYWVRNTDPYFPHYVVSSTGTIHTQYIHIPNCSYWTLHQVLSIDYIAFKCELTPMSTLYRTKSQIFLNSTLDDLFFPVYRHFFFLISKRIIFAQ
jgi:hypothetical protein